MAIANILNLTGTGPITADGSGGFTANSLTEGGVLLGGASNTISDTGVLAKGTILVGDGTTAPTLLAIGDDDAVLTADSGETSGLIWTLYGQGVWEELSSQTASTSSSLNFTGMTQDYASYWISFSGLVPTADASNLILRTSANGSTYDSGASDYDDGSAGPASSIPVASSAGNDTGESCSGDILILDPQASTYTFVFVRSMFIDSTGSPSGLYDDSFLWSRASAAAVEAVQLVFDGTTIASGDARLFRRY